MPAASRYVQDMPPEGGYAPFNFKRVPLKPMLDTKWLIGGHLAISAAAYYIYFLTLREVTRDGVEMRSCRNVMLPVLLAQRDRRYLKQLRKNRDDEAKLMADVPGWVVGTWYGEPIYKTRPKEQWFNPMMQEFYCHTSDKNFYERADFNLWT